MVSPYLYPLFAVLAWGANAVVLKVLVAYLPPHAMNSLRTLIAALCFLLWWWFSSRQQLGWRDWLWIGAAGFVGNTLYQQFFLEGVPRLPASYAALLNSTSALWVALLSVWWLREPLKPLRLAGLLLSLLGVGLLAMGHPSPSQLAGVGFMLLAALSWAIYTVSARVLAKGYKLLTWTALGFALGVAPYFVWHAPQAFSTPLSAPVWVWILLVLSALLAVVLAFSAWMHAVRLLGPVRVAVFGNLTPIVGVLLGVLLLGESFSGLALLGGALTVAGIALAQR